LSHLENELTDTLLNENLIFTSKEVDEKARGALFYVSNKFNILPQTIIQNYVEFKNFQYIKNNDIVILISIKYQTHLSNEQIFQLYNRVQNDDSLKNKEHAASILAHSLGVTVPIFESFILAKDVTIPVPSSAGRSFRRAHGWEIFDVLCDFLNSIVAILDIFN
jgi:uncharacterized protein YqhQ